jgi:hypothetical protein
MRRSVTAALALLGLVVASPVLAQRTTGAISGTVHDASGAALPGVTVTVTGPNIVGTETATTNDQGFYRFINLPPGDYALGFTMSGFKSITRRGVRVGVGATIEENAALEISQLQESVDVVAEATVVDTTSNEVGSNYDRDWVDNAPLRRFSFFDLVAAAPGSLQGGDSNNTSRTMVFGSSYDENSFQVDGVDVTDNYFNEALAEPNTDAIEEIEVLSLGAPAEYGNLTGAVYNIVTRQGTNEFHGDAGFYLQTDSLTSNNTENLANPDGSFLDACPDGESRCPFTRDRFTDISLQLGGPIVKDKLWFFASYSNQRDYYWDVGVDSSNELTAVRGRTDRYFGKLNWQLNAKHKLVGTFHYDDKVDDNGLSANSSPETAATRSASTPTPGLGYTGVLSDRTVVEVRYSGFYGDVQFNPTDPNQPRDLNRFYDIDTGFISGGHYYWYDLGPKRTTVTAKVSHLADNFLGSSHDFRFGVQYSAASAGGLVGYNDLIYTYSQSSPGYGYGISYTPFSYSGDTKAIGVFLDDTVRVSNRLSFNLGLRFDSQKAFSAERPQLDEFGNPTGVNFPQTDYFTWNTLSPRVGLNWKLTGDGKTVFKAHYGRYHRAVATGEYANKLGPSITPIFVGPFDIPSGTFGDLTLSRSNENLGFDPDYESPYTDQFIASIERELRPGLGAQLNYVRKRGSREPDVAQADVRQLAAHRFGHVAPRRGLAAGRPGRRRRGRLRGRDHPARRPPVPAVRPEPELLRERGRPPQERRRMAVQGAGHLPLPGRLPGLGQLHEPQRSPSRAAYPRPAQHHPGPGEHAHPAAAARRKRTAGEPPHPGPAPPEGLQGGRRRRHLAVRRRLQPAQPRHHGRRGDVAGGVFVVPLPAVAGEPAALHGGRQAEVLSAEPGAAHAAPGLVPFR